MVPTIALIGPMGAGKSTIGRLLAQKLHYEFLDTDQLIEERSGADIPWIFDVEGEQGFRDREASVLAEVMRSEHTVIATGGGIVLREENRRLLQQAPMVIYLTAEIDQLIERTYKDKKRPLLQVSDPEQRIRELFSQRDPIYRDLADHTIVTDGSSTKNAVNAICRALE